LVALLSISIGIVFVGIVCSLVLMVRSGESRVGLLTLCFALLAVRQGVALWQLWGTPLDFDAATGAEVSMVVASGLGLLILAALWRTLAERDRAESLHWDSMEAVRILGELAAQSNLSLDEKLGALLRIGCERFDLEIGMISRVHKQRYEVIAIRAPEEFPVARGAVFMLADTYCGRTLESERPVACERIGDSARLGHPDRAAFGFGAYLGSAFRVYDEVVGTICFGSRRPRKRRFTATDKDLLNLMSQWIGSDFERRFGAEEREANAARAAESARTPPDRAYRRDDRIPRSVDVNAAIRRSDTNIRFLVGPGVDLEYGLAESLQPAAVPRIAVGAIVESLVRKAAEFLSGDGRIAIETANLEVANGDPDVIPAVAPNHYVTLSVTASGEGIDAETLSRAFEPSAAEAKGGSEWNLRDRVPLETIYRLLQRCGGDLSLEVEPGKGSTFTVFLPRADAEAPRPRPALPLSVPSAHELS
jgi:hypothetical protein